MGKSQSLRLSDIRQVYALVHECCELWADPDAWRTHLLLGAVRLTDSMTGILERFTPSPLPNRPALDHIASVGWPDAGSRRAYQRVIDDQPEMPSFDKALPRLMRNGSVAFARQFVSPHREWYSSEFFQDYMRQADSDHFIASLKLVAANAPPPPAIETLSVGRHLSDSLYDHRQVRLLQLLHEEILPLIGTRLTTEKHRSIAGLPPRCKPTLNLLLQGASESEIAQHSCRSVNTIHEHVKAIYKHFNVTSRSKLLAYFVNRQPQLLQNGEVNGSCRAD